MPNSQFSIRPATDADSPAVKQVHTAAFPTASEARLVMALGASGKQRVSLVALHAGDVVGHVLFSPVTLDRAETGGLGMAPVAVLPEYQGRGAGRQLIEAGLSQCRADKVPYVVVLGAPAYYQRFGFGRASALNLSNIYSVDAEFMVLPLTEDALPGAGGLVEYATEFNAL